MRKIICYCDICKKETPDNALSTYFDPKVGYEICKVCCRNIITKVINGKLINLTPWCKICNGVGTIEESVSYEADGRNKYETIKCKECEI